jgi:hypothetical protein
VLCPDESRLKHFKAVSYTSENVLTFEGDLFEAKSFVMVFNQKHMPKVIRRLVHNTGFHPVLCMLNPFRVLNCISKKDLTSKLSGLKNFMRLRYSSDLTYSA